VLKVIGVPSWHQQQKGCQRHAACPLGFWPAKGHNILQLVMTVVQTTSCCAQSAYHSPLVHTSCPGAVLFCSGCAHVTAQLAHVSHLLLSSAGKDQLVSLHACNARATTASDILRQARCVALVCKHAAEIVCNLSSSDSTNSGFPLPFLRSRLPSTP